MEEVVAQEACVKCGDTERNTQSKCRTCSRAYNRAWYAANLTENRARVRRNSASYRQRDPEGTAKEQERLRLLNKYGLTVAERTAMEVAQGGVCAIYSNTETIVNVRTGKPKALHVDHCHKTGKIRGLLCSRHNKGMGLFNDDPALLRAAAAYLEGHQL